MARLPRLAVAGHVHHVLQRGNNRQPIFIDAEDYQRMLSLLAEHAAREKVAIHAYVLMGTEFHLLATPESDNGLSTMMQSVGRRYVQYFNKRHQRSGTLWEGRYRATLLQPERWLINSKIFIDLNPVRGGLVTRALDYRWSSHGHYVGHHVDKLVTPHALYWGLGNTPFAREARYAELVSLGLNTQQHTELMESVLKGWPLGDAKFVEGVQKQTLRRVVRRRAGRPQSKQLSS
ncbi:transposase [Stenotrophobium rhamnosiphilum]|uniref:Transposase n=1 Tax=Stenotrophobium rhamnosiphilum TaxID=2029166 RepID=A0A2T5MFE9_9GAMM|nr:transposase [Stenotrophobium rhamnosiphilum]PTU31269.1 transposase [Stenotrophobium rhamnosiphilum]